ncbi:hypothetical protein RCO28_26430 [Streptomyces sp. LHD-70]|uniref:hypothetical protein n=1 Tax=Streptomyces sp. LHD-70 TaxID=3072140 RepID=UPI00280E26C9|nr:hypothetical protein [Streptomyces sp. LHD-70]MDQ8705992.1 hypothetical protein [Streptomyces sp. LHD-70]
MTTSTMTGSRPEARAAVASPEPARTVDTADCFDFSCLETLIIDSPVDTVYDALFKVTEWPVHLPHVQQIDVSYDDGQYQEFWMTVASETDGSPLRVRSIRNCRYRQIEFFQPQPPRFLRHHAGIWRFIPQEGPEGADRTLVEVTHLWNLEPEIAAEVYPATPDRSTAVQVEEMLAGHSRLALASWQAVLGKPSGASGDAKKEG